MEKRTSLVLEGGGMRGAFTAGCLCWLLENNISFDSGYGISTGAVHLVNFLMKRPDYLKSFSTKYIADKRIIGAKSIFRCARIVDYDFLFDEMMPNELNFSIDSLKDIEGNGKIGLYDLKAGETIYKDVKQISMTELKASTSLPILGKIVKIDDNEYLDGGITKMIPIEAAIEEGMNRHLIISTKPIDYVRKPAKKIVVNLMRAMYPRCKNISSDYQIRHINFQKQIDIIKELENKEEAVYIYPTKHSNVTRLGGSEEDLLELFELGKTCMEENKERIFKLLKDE